MSQLDEMPKTYANAVAVLARWHATQDPTGIEIFAFDDPAQERVRLLEVSETFAETGRVTAWPFGRSKDFPFRSSVAQIPPSEWRAVRDRELALPDGWDLAVARRVYPPI